MGSGVSLCASEEGYLTKDEAKALMNGAEFDEATFDSKANSDGLLSASIWNEAVITFQKEESSSLSQISIREAVDVNNTNTEVKGGAAELSELELRVNYFLGLDEKELEKQTELVLETLNNREKKRAQEAKKRKKEAETDYSKGLSGTKADTKAEREFVDLMTEMDGKKELPEDEFAIVLRVIREADTDQYEKLREKGKWKKVSVIHADGLPGVSYLHTITCEESFSKPFDFIEEKVISDDKVDPNAGFPSCDMEDIIEYIEKVKRVGFRTCTWDFRCILGDDDVPLEPKTPLLIDTSEDDKMLTFFKYKGIVVELEPLGWSRKRQAAAKVSGGQIMEEARRLAVVAMKHGKTLALNFGKMESNCEFKEVFCKETTINELIFEAGGKKLISGKPKPFCKKMWKEKEMKCGEIVIDNEFRVVLITAHKPADVIKELSPGIPMELVQPVVVKYG